MESEVTSEVNDVKVDNEDTLNLSNQGGQSKSEPTSIETPGIRRESFSIFNFKNKNKIPDGIYFAHLSENVMYGKFDNISLTKNKVIVDSEIFKIEEEINLTEAKSAENIDITLVENVDGLLTLLKDKSQIIIKIPNN